MKRAMDAEHNKGAGGIKVKKTLTLNSRAVEYGESMAVQDHRGCLSNQIDWLLEQEWKRRQTEAPGPAPAESGVAA